LGNVINPFDVIETYGSDPMRWYMITNAAPWENLKFDLEGVDEVRRKFFGTLYNTYSFFSLYANVDGWNFSENEIPVNERPEIDRWIISLLNSLVKEAENAYENYEPTRAGRAIQNFVGENLSNWYVRLNRKRFWGGEINKDKQAAYQTLYTCLLTVSKLAAPIAPFYTDVLFSDLNKTTGKETIQSVHLTLFPKVDETLINAELEERMALAQKISSMTLGLRRKENLKVRQPLQKIMIPVLTQELEQNIESVKDIILTEINVKAIEYLNDAAGILVKKIKPNFKTLGKKYGKHMKAISAALSVFTQTDIAAIEREKQFSFESAGENVLLTLEDVEITSQDIPGWTVATEGNITVALDVTISEELKHEGIAREFINKIQNLRKDSGFEVTDKINLQIQKHEYVNQAVENFKEYISSQTLASSIVLIDEVIGGKEELINEATVFIKVAKV
jgi:isoleucyl-tRNA synthetase